MSRRVEAAAFTAALAFLAALFLALGWGLESRGRLGPILLAAGVLPLTLLQLRRDLTGPIDDKPSPPNEKAGLAWALALPPAIYLLGCLFGVALHTFLFVRLIGERSWPLSAVYALLVAAPVYALAELMLRPELLTGLLWRAWL